MTTGTTGTSGSPETPGSPTAQPEGLVAYTIYNPPAGAPATAPVFNRSVVGDSLIHGLDVSIAWCDVEPHHDVFNWGPLDTVFREADSVGDFVDLTIVPGFLSPRWALRGVPSVTSGFTYFGPGAKRRLPLPWETTYLDRWYSFLRALADRYDTYTAFHQIEVAGPTSVSTEMSLPDWTGAPTRSPNVGVSGDTGLPARFHGNDIEMWIKEGYTPALYERAWAQTFAVYHRIFPNQYLGLSLIPGLPIGNNHRIDGAQITATTLAVIREAMRYKSQLVIQADGLSAGSGKKPPYPYVPAHIRSAVRV